MPDVEGRRLLLGVAGGIAAYKAVALTSRLVQEGALVAVIMNEAAQRFVTPLSFAALTGRRVYTSLWEAPESIPHLALVRAARIPLLVAPAMNSAMYEHAATIENLRTLRARGVTIVEPAEGFFAEREYGIGRLADEDVLLAAIRRALARRTELRGQRV